jgi:protein-tyrosine phosphatase
MAATAITKNHNIQSFVWTKMSQEEISKQKNRWYAERYASRLGFVQTNWHRLLYILGRHHKYQLVNLQSVERLVFVCKGNICRSAYAEAVARSLGIEAISCGIDTIEDAPANKSAVLIARKRGLHLEEHRTKPIMYLILRKTDLLVAMEPWQANYLDKHLSRKHYCTLLGLWLQPALPYIHDPYGASPVYFENCFRYIEKSVHELAKQIENTRKI